MLQALLARGGVSLGAQELDQLWRYYVLLHLRNPDHALTASVGLQDVAIKHFLDCAMVPDFVSLPSPLLDIGSGAGFPGVVLKIMKPELHVVLAEERPRKAAFLRELLAELALSDVEVFARRVWAQSPLDVSAVITRAVEPVLTTLMRCRRFLRPGAAAIFMKGPSVDSELRDAARRSRDAYVLRKDIAYALPGTSYQRRILVYERTS